MLSVQGSSADYVAVDRGIGSIYLGLELRAAVQVRWDLSECSVDDWSL